MAPGATSIDDGISLAGLTAEREMILDPGSYFQRSTDSARLPGVRSTTSP
jgi:hypothetical protein